jgi:hypothetical protein
VQRNFSSQKQPDEDREFILQQAKQALASFHPTP